MFDSLGFSPDWEVDVDPPVPPDERWGCPVHRFPSDDGAAPQVAIDAARQPATSLVARFRREDGSEWVGYFATRGGGRMGVYACPKPGWALVIADEYAYLVDVGDPERPPEPSFNRMFYRGIDAARVPGRDLVLIWNWIRAVALGRDGVTWDALLFAMNEQGVDLLGLTHEEVSFRIALRDHDERIVISMDSGERLSVEPLTGPRRLRDSFTVLTPERAPSIRTFDLDLPGSLIDLDLTPTGGWVAILGGREGKLVSIAGRTITLPHAYRVSQIRAIDEVTVLVYSPRARSHEPNAIVLRSTGEIASEFAIGDGIQDVLASPSALVALYFDEGIFGGVWPSWEGVAVFEPTGELRFGYGSQFGSDAVGVGDAYAGCWTDRGTVQFMPYMDFPLVELDLERRTQEIAPTPEVLHGAHALTSVGGEIFVHSPYDSQSTIWRWLPSEEPQPIGDFGPVLRGLRGGRFLAFRDREYAVISVA